MVCGIAFMPVTSSFVVTGGKVSSSTILWFISTVNWYWRVLHAVDSSNHQLVFHRNLRKKNRRQPFQRMTAVGKSAVTWTTDEAVALVL